MTTETRIFEAGDGVTIASCSFKHLIGRSATVIRSDAIDKRKLKVSFDDEWVGYFYPEQLIHDEDYWRVELQKVIGCPTRTDTTQQQLQDLVVIAKQFGFADAAVYIHSKLIK